MPRAPQHRSEETHAHLLQAAAECFAQGGYDGTGVAEICARAGVSKGAFYHHFPTKQAVFLALLEQWLGSLDQLMTTLRTEAPSVPLGLHRMAEVAPGVFTVGANQLPMFLEFLAQASRDPETWRATVAPYRRYREMFAEMIRGGVTEGTLRPVDPDAAAHVIVSLAVGLVLQGVLDPQGADWPRVTRESIDILLKGLEPTRP